MNGVDLSFISAVDEVFHHGISDFAVLSRGANDCNGFWFHDPAHGRENFVLAGAVAMLLRFPVADDTHIGSDPSRLRREEPVQIPLGDVGQIAYQLRNAD